MPRRSNKAIESDFIQEALKHYEQSKRFDLNEREKAREDIKFAQMEGEQWDLRFNVDKDRPRYEINRIQHAINQVVGEYSKNQLSVKVRAATEIDEPLSETYDGIVRHILTDSKFKMTQLETLKEVCNGGFGCWRILSNYSREDSFDQDLEVKWIPDSLSSVWFDAFDKDPLKRNSRWAFIVEDLDPAEFKQRYPNSALNSFDNIPERDQLKQKGWIRSDGIRIAEYFKRVPVKRKIVQLNTGETYDFEEIKSVIDELTEQGIQVVKERMVDCHQIEWYKISGIEILESKRIWPGKHIPVIPVFGFHYWVDKRFTFRGMVRFAKDAQRIYNYTTSAKVEAAARSPKDPIFITDDMIDGYEQEYTQFNVSNSPFLRFNPSTGDNTLPFRLGAPEVQPALTEQAAQADADLQATLGRNQAALGDVNMGVNHAPSGNAISKVQYQSNVGQEELFANLVAAIEHTGQVLVDVIPYFYDTERQMQILKPDGQSEFVTVNQEMIDTQTGEKVMLNDLSKGKYSVKVSLGQSFETQRQETIAMLQALAMNNPEFMTVTADLMAKSIDHPAADEIENRIRMQMINAGIIEPNEMEAKKLAEKEANTPPDPMQELQLESLKLQLQEAAGRVDFLEAEIIEKQLSAQKTISEIENKEADTAKVFSDMIVDQVKVGLEENKQIMEAMAKQTQDAVATMQNGMSEQVNAAFRSLANGIYQTEDGQVVQVQDGQAQPVDLKNPDMPTPGTLPGEGGFPNPMS